MQMEKKIQEQTFHLLERKNRCVCLYPKVPILPRSIYFLEIHSMKDVISPIVELIFKQVPFKK
jgi:hypothetical protein